MSPRNILFWSRRDDKVPHLVVILLAITRRDVVCLTSGHHILVLQFWWIINLQCYQFNSRHISFINNIIGNILTSIYVLKYLINHKPNNQWCSPYVFTYMYIHSHSFKIFILPNLSISQAIWLVQLYIAFKASFHLSCLN